MEAKCYELRTSRLKGNPDEYFKLQLLCLGAFLECKNLGTFVPEDNDPMAADQGVALAL